MIIGDDSFIYNYFKEMFIHVPRLLKRCLILLTLLFFYFPVLVAAERISDKYGGTAVFVTTSDPKSFNDIIAKETSTSVVTNYIFEGLVKLNAFTLKPEPNLAERWSISKDGLKWRFYLRKGVRWNDGVEFTADDVVFTFNDLIYNPDIPSSARDVFTIDGKTFKVRKIDKYTVEFTLPVKFAPFLVGMTQSILPKHKLQAAVKSGRFNFTWGIDTEPKEIVGTGPYMLDKYEPGERIVFKRNPYYWKRSKEGDRLPYIDKIIVLIVKNSDVALLKFMEGSVDSIGLRGMDYALLKPYEKRDNFTIYELGPDRGSQFLVFNQNRGVNPKTGKPFVSKKKLSWFTNLAFRRAVAHAIDKQKIIEIVKYGFGYPQYSPIGPGEGFFHNPDVIKYEYNLNKARDILAKAGFKDINGDGYIEDSEGNTVEFNLFTNSGNTERIDIAGIIRSDLERLGMKVNFQALEFNTLVSKLTSTFEWDAVVLGLTGGVDPHFAKNVWTSSGQLHMWYPRQEHPVTEWEARIDELFRQGAQELDENKRKKIYDEFQMIVSRQLPMIYTVLGANIAAVRNKFGNLHPSNNGGVFHNIEEIYIKKEYR